MVATTCVMPVAQASGARPTTTAATRGGSRVSALVRRRRAAAAPVVSKIITRRGSGGRGRGGRVTTAAADTGAMNFTGGPASLDELDMERGACVIAPKYSPVLVRERALSSPLECVLTLARGVEIVWAAGTFAGGLLYDKFQKAEDVVSRSDQLRIMLAELGPSFVKAGQVLANRPDIVRADYMEQLCKLQDDVPPFPNEQAFRIIEEELGRPIDEVYSELSPEPIAAASLGQVYKGRLLATGEDVAIKVQRPGIEPVIYRDLVLFRGLAFFINQVSIRRLGCNAQLIVDEFGEKLLEELDYVQEGRNLRDFYDNYYNDPIVKIPKFYPAQSGARILTMEWIDGVRCTDPDGIRAAGIDVDNFIKVGVMSGLRQLLEFGLFHGDPHPGNIFAMQDGRIAYVDFGNVAQLSNRNKQILVDAVVHAVNEDYRGMADDFINLGFLAPGTDVNPIVPALEQIWTDCRGQSLATFNFRTVTDKFNKLVYRYPIRIPERYALVIRSLLTQEGICMTLEPDFKFLEVAFPYIAKRLLTDEDPILRERLLQVLFKDDTFQWARLENLITLAADVPSGGNTSLDLSETVVDGAKVFLSDEYIRNALILALTQDDRLHVEEVLRLGQLLRGSVEPQVVVESALLEGPRFMRSVLQTWSDNVIADGGPRRRFI